MPEEAKPAAPEEKTPNFWVTLPGILTALAGLLTASTGLLIALNQTGVIGDDDPTSPAALVDTESPDGDEDDDENDDAGHPLAGQWRGQASSPSNGYQSTLEIDVSESCELRAPCGSIQLAQPPCWGDIELWSVDGMTFEFYVSGFSAESDGNCTEGAGDFFTLVDDNTLRYTTDYSDVTGTLTRVE